MFNIYNSNKEKIRILTNVINPILDTEINRLDILTFEVPKNEIKYIKVEGYVESATQNYVIKEITEKRETFLIFCKQNVEDFDEYITNKTYSTKTFEFMARDILPNGWKLNAKVDTRKRTITANNVSRWEILLDIVEKFNLEFSIDNRTKILFLGNKLGNDNGVYYTDELNLESMYKTEETHEYFTRIIPVGNNNLTIESVNGGKNYIDDFSYTSKIKTFYWEDNRFLDVNSLKDTAIEKLRENSSPKVNYDISVIDLSSNVKYRFLKANKGDTVTIIDRNTKQSRKLRVIKIKKFLDNSILNEIILGNKLPDLKTDEQKLKEIFNENWEKTRTYFDVTDDKINGIVEKVNNQDGVISSVRSEIVQKAEEIDLSINKANSFVDRIESLGSDLSLRTDAIESNVYFSSTDVEPFFSLSDFVVSAGDVFEHFIEFEPDTFYDFKFRAKGRCKFLLKFFVDSNERKYPYKYFKKFKQYIRVVKDLDSSNFKNGVVFFKTPSNLKSCKLFIKADDSTDISFFKVSKNASKLNLERITKLRQDLDGFKLTVQDNQNEIRSEIVQKSNEISSRINDERNRVSNEISQINDQMELKVSKDNLITAINLSPERLKIDSSRVEVHGDMFVYGILGAYKGDIGGFTLGEKNGHYWFTGSSSFNHGMSDGTDSTRSAIWANWGDDWNRPSSDCWRVTGSGVMHCGNDAYFHSGLSSSGTISVGSSMEIRTDDIYWDGDNKVVWHSQLTNASDFNLKENIKPSSVKALDVLSKVDVVEFDWKDEAKEKADKEGHVDIGFVAQWLEKQIPEAIRDVKDMKAVRYSDLVPYLVKAVQELKDEIDFLKRENEVLKEAGYGINTD